ncbi:MAG: hypothetical protein N2Z22_04010 [Turneriella sp.]|nr:hypothetical protein [Turneriella sp.]
MKNDHIIRRQLAIAEPFYSACRYAEEKLQQHGYEGYLVGGSVRDLLTSGKLSDLDYATDATPEEVQKIFPRTVPVGIKFGTVLVLHRGVKIEITTYRTEADYGDARRPGVVQYARDLYTDIQRRDFTVNGLAYSVLRGELIDYCGGLADLEARILRTIGDPMARFREDGLRPLRGCRIAARLGLTITPETLDAMRACADVAAKVAAERFYDEWRKTLRMPARGAFWKNLLAAGILPAFLPQLVPFFATGLAENFLHAIDVLPLHSMAEYAAAIFVLLQVKDERVMAETMEHSRFPTAQMKLCKSLLKSPLWAVPDLPDYQRFKEAIAQIRRSERFIHVRFIRALRAVLMQKQGPGLVPEFRAHWRKLYHALRRSGEPLDVADLKIGGEDLLALGLSGPAVGAMLEKLRQHVLRHPEDNRKESLAQLVQQEPVRPKDR